MNSWNTLKNGEREELGLLQIDIVGHSKLQDTDRILKEAKGTFKQLTEGIVTTRGGRLFNWGGDGGSFMFQVKTGEGFNSMCFSALQMLNSLPAINEEIAILTRLTNILSVRISCDSGMAVYDNDPALISGDFVNKFLKNERNLSLKDTVSVTDRVWRQLHGELKEKFRPFKFSKEVESMIYNYGGKERQLDVLNSLSNIDKDEKPPDRPEFVEIVAFKGDTLASLSKYAYADVVVKNHENVGGLNLLTSKNAQRCLEHTQHGTQQIDEEDSGSPRRSMRAGGPSYYEPEPSEEFQGGESLRFYNCVALGYAPIIGEGTLLDHVLAGNLLINRVVGGVSEPTTKLRTFEMVEGRYREVETEQETKREGKVTEDDEEAH